MFLFCSKCSLQEGNKNLLKIFLNKQVSSDTTYMGNLKYDTNECIYKRERHKDTENKLMVTKQERELRRDKLGIWD